MKAKRPFGVRVKGFVRFVSCGLATLAMGPVMGMFIIFSVAIDGAEDVAEAILLWIWGE